VTGADEDIIEPIDYPMTLRPKQYKAARQAVDLIEPVERNQTPKIHALNYEITILASGTRSARDACRMDVEAALWDIGLALYIEDFYSFGVTKADKGKARQIARALRRVDDLVRDFNKRDFPLNPLPFRRTDEMEEGLHQDGGDTVAKDHSAECTEEAPRRG
jgi:hypothetical protein